MTSSATASTNPYKATHSGRRVPVSVTRKNFITAVHFILQAGPLHEHYRNERNHERMYLLQLTWSREYKWQANQKWGALSGSSRKMAQIDTPPNRTSTDTNSDVETDNICGQLAAVCPRPQFGRWLAGSQHHHRCWKCANANWYVLRV